MTALVETPLPTFVYHPDSIANNVFIPSEVVCECCRQPRGYNYQGGYYAQQEVTALCPWCIYDGKAHAQLGVEFTPRIGVGNRGLWGDVESDIVDIVAYRTPGFQSWQPGKWWVCCSDAALFHKAVGRDGLSAYGEDAVHAIRLESGLVEEEWVKYFEQLDEAEGPTAYIFQCRHCSRYGGYSDRRAESAELDVSQVLNVAELYGEVVTALKLPSESLRNKPELSWDDLLELMLVTCQTPDQLLIHGLDHLEKSSPLAADSLLRCLGEYNRRSRRTCRVAVSDDYNTAMFFVSYRVSDTARGPLIVDCWVKADSAREAHKIAQSTIVARGWRIISHEEMHRVDMSKLADEDGSSFVRQACVDGAVFNYRSD